MDHDNAKHERVPSRTVVELLRLSYPTISHYSPQLIQREGVMAIDQNTARSLTYQQR